MNGGYTFNSDLPNFASPSIFLSPYVPSPPEALDKKGLNCGECDRETRHSGIMSSNFASDFDKTELSDDTLNNGTYHFWSFLFCYFYSCQLI
jgi:hypothetical protein